MASPGTTALSLARAPHHGPAAAHRLRRPGRISPPFGLSAARGLAQWPALPPHGLQAL